MTKVTDEQLIAWADGELSAEHSAQIEMLIANDPDIAKKAASFEASKLPYKAAIDSDIPPVPSELVDQVAQWSQIAAGSYASNTSVSSTANRKSLRYWSGAVASVLFCGGVLWGGISYLSPQHPAEDWREAIVSYQNFYVTETVSHIVADPAAALQKLNELKQRYTAFPKAPPDLTAQGYSFKRLQRLDFANQPVLQMVFYKAGKRPLAICLMPDNVEIKPQFIKHNLLNSYIWHSGKLRGIVVAEEESAVLRGIASLVEI